MKFFRVMSEKFFKALIKKMNLIRIILFHKIDYLFGRAIWDVPFVFAVFEIHYCVEKVGIFTNAIILLSISCTPIIFY